MQKTTKQKRILFVATDDWFFKSHFMHLAEAAKANGFDVGFAMSLSSSQIRSGDPVFALTELRGRKSLLSLWRNVRELQKAIAVFQPDIVQLIGLQNILVFTLALQATTRAKFVLVPTGLGRFWVDEGFKAWAMRVATRGIVNLFRGSRFHFIFENDEDARALWLPRSIPQTIVGGAGIDESLFLPLPAPPEPPLKLALVARMIHAKGILQTVEAVKRARRSIDVTLDIYGAPDPANSGSLTLKELESLNGNGIKWHGSTTDIQSVWREAHIGILLSKREGLPRSLLEVAACGRALIVSDVAGCRSLVRNGVEGLVIAADDIDQTSRAIVTLSHDKALRERMGKAARQRVLDGFTQTQVAEGYISAYTALLRT